MNDNNYKLNIIKAVSRLGETNGTKNPDSRNNVGAALGKVYLWRVAVEIATDRLKTAWNDLTNKELIPEDEILRKSIEGETVAIKSPSFGLQIKVSKPRESFDKDAFLDKVSKKFKIEKHKLIELSKECTKLSKAPLSKKIVELR